MNVCVVGASSKPDRYSYKAMKMLQEKGHIVFPVHPKLEEIEGTKVYCAVSDIPEPVDTVTLYVGEKRSTAIADDLVKLKPRRVIFNPGAENPKLKAVLDTLGIQTFEACTLVMIITGLF